MRVVVLTEQLRRRVPGGIGTYIRGLLGGLARLPDGPDVAPWTPALPPAVVTRLWDRGRLRVKARGGVIHAPTLALPPTDDPIAVFVHDVAWRDVPDAYPERGRRWHEAALDRALGRAAAILVPSAATADALGPTSVPVTVIPEGCDHLPPPDDAGADALLSGLGVGRDFLLTVGTIQPRKNLGRLLEAYAKARPRLDGLPLVVVGAHGWVETLAPVEGAVLAGSPSDAVLAALYRRARALAYVPLAEGFGLPPVEAMHAGLPVLASPLPSTGAAALTVDPLDVGAIADGLVAVAADGATRDRLVAAGRTHTASMRWVDAAAAHVAVWETLR